MIGYAHIHDALGVALIAILVLACSKMIELLCFHAVNRANTGFPLTAQETINALRANVSKLQGDVDRTKFHCAGVERSMGQLREQHLLDRRYLDSVKAAAWNVVEGVKPSGDGEFLLRVLRETLEGSGPDTHTAS